MQPRTPRPAPKRPQSVYAGKRAEFKGSYVPAGGTITV